MWNLLCESTSLVTVLYNALPTFHCYITTRKRKNARYNISVDIYTDSSAKVPRLGEREKSSPPATLQPQMSLAPRSIKARHQRAPFRIKNEGMQMAVDWGNSKPRPVYYCCCFNRQPISLHALTEFGTSPALDSFRLAINNTEAYICNQWIPATFWAMNWRTRLSNLTPPTPPTKE